MDRLRAAAQRHPDTIEILGPPPLKRRGRSPQKQSLECRKATGLPHALGWLQTTYPEPGGFPWRDRSVEEIRPVARESEALGAVGSEWSRLGNASPLGALCGNGPGDLDSLTSKEHHGMNNMLQGSDSRQVGYPDGDGGHARGFAPSPTPRRVRVLFGLSTLWCGCCT